MNESRNNEPDVCSRRLDGEAPVMTYRAERTGALRLWCRGGRTLDDGYRFRPFGRDRVALFHRKAGVVDEHLLAFATAPREKAQEMLFADVLGAGGRIHSRLTPLDHTCQIVHDGDSK